MERVVLPVDLDQKLKQAYETEKKGMYKEALQLYVKIGQSFNRKLVKVFYKALPENATDEQMVLKIRDIYSEYLVRHLSAIAYGPFEFDFNVFDMLLSSTLAINAFEAYPEDGYIEYWEKEFFEA